MKFNYLKTLQQNGNNDEPMNEESLDGNLEVAKDTNSNDVLRATDGDCDWSDKDRGLLRELCGIFSNNYCVIAKTLHPKTCRQVSQNLIVKNSWPKFIDRNRKETNN